MDTELRAELLALRALMLLTLGQVAAAKPDANQFLDDALNELVRALGGVRVEPEAHQDAVRARAVAFAKDWLGHIHFKDDDSPAPY